MKPSQFKLRPVPALPPAPLTPFLKAVRKVILAIRRGTTLAYGEVALRAGKPRGARAVVRALHVLDDVPWWRVCRSGGTFAPQVAFEQEQLLRQEGWKPKVKKQRRAASGARPAKGARGRRRKLRS
jgi:methylated-DNA-protein-cysteine methyltransferase related protein